METRLVRAEDMQAAYELMCELEEEALDAQAFRRIYEADLLNPDSPCLIAEENGDVAGFLHLRMEEQLHHCEKIAEIMELMVRSGVRSRGVGALLFQAAVQMARERGCAGIELASNRKRERAHAFYMRQGMRMTHVKLTMPLTNGEA